MIRKTTFGDLKVGEKFATIPLSFVHDGTPVEIPSEVYKKVADLDADETCLCNAKKPNVSYASGGGAIFWKESEVIAL